MGRSPRTPAFWKPPCCKIVDRWWADCSLAYGRRPCPRPFERSMPLSRESQFERTAPRRSPSWPTGQVDVLPVPFRPLPLAGQRFTTLPRRDGRRGERHFVFEVLRGTCPVMFPVPGPKADEAAIAAARDETACDLLPAMAEGMAVVSISRRLSTSGPSNPLGSAGFLFPVKHNSAFRASGKLVGNGSV